MNKKLKKYENFNIINESEEEIKKVLKNIVNNKIKVSMLNDTIKNVCSSIEKSLPLELEQFTSALEKYDYDISCKVEDIISVMIDGYSNIKDLIEETENNIIEIENFLKKDDI